MERLNRLLDRVYHAQLTGDHHGPLPVTVRVKLVRHFVAINRQYALLYRETVHHNRLMQRYNSIGLVGYILLAAFIAYMIFITDLDFSMLLLYCFAYINLILLICVVIFGCAQISSANKQLGLQMLHFYNVAQRSSIFTNRDLVKVS